jgi:acetyl esterase/lipase
MLTFTYKQVQGIKITLDLYLPLTSDSTAHTLLPKGIPIVVNFHGGGLTVGETNSWFPAWLKG